MPGCSTGAVVKPGAPDAEWLDIARLIAGSPLSFQQPIAWALAAWASTLKSVPDICALNPTAPLPLTTLDIIESTSSFATGGVIGENKVLRYIGDWLLYDLFLRNCDCVQPPPPTGLACPYANSSWSLGAGAAGAAVPYDIPQSVYDAWFFQGVPPNENWYPVWQYSMTTHDILTTQHWLDWSADQVTWHPFYEFPHGTAPLTSTCSEQFPLQPPRMPRAGFIRPQNRSAVTFSVTGFNFCFCALAPTPPPNDIPTRDPGTPDAPPGLCGDLDVCAAINDISRRLRQLGELVTLLQRYELPFALVPGAAHSSLTGSGSFAVSRLIGMRVNVTSHTTSRPDLEGNPAYVWDQGWMSILTGDGMIEEKRISQTHFEWLPKQMPLALTFGYDLRPGTIVTFTELEAET